MPPIPLYRETTRSGVRENFYVPHFEVKVAGRGLPDDVIQDVLQVSYKDSVEEIDSFELVVNNWDAQKGKFKYEPASQQKYAQLFDPGQKLELWMGYLKNLRLMLKGEITTLEPNFPEASGSTLTVRGLNVLHSLRKKQHTWSWEKIRDSDIAQELGKQPVADDRPGLGIEVRLADGYRNRETEETFVFMNNQYDILFLLERARRHNYALYLEVDGITGAQFLYFGPSERVRDVTYELEWGKTLMQFRPTLTTVNQISQVTVRGWDRRTRKPIAGIAHLEECDLNRDQTAVARAVQGRHEVITNRPVHTPQDATKMARDILCQQLREMIKASGVTVGLPDLRAGRKLHIKKLGARFDGEYFITDTTHTVGDGYRTTFNARREKAVPQ
jgi:uncharacterized protein